MILASHTRFAPVAAAAAAAVAVGALGGCVDVNGGAVELVWVFQKPDGKVVADCAIAGVARVSLCAQPDDAGSAPTCRDWPCEAGLANGGGGVATPFDLAPGRYAFTLAPLCSVTTDTSIGQVPPPLLRDVVFGQVTTLDALLVVADAAGRVCAPAS